jgi:type II secretory pathway pseudopilin PulG
MRPTQIQLRTDGARRRLQRGFTLLETILVIGMLTLVSLGILSMQPQVFKTQTNGRDQFVGFELMRACAERLLAVRRATGFGSVTSSLCNGMGGVGGFASNPTVTLADANANSITTCSSATCTATIIVAKSVAPAATLTPITLRLSAY